MNSNRGRGDFKKNFISLDAIVMLASGLEKKIN
jgi:hypothetical protein